MGRIGRALYKERIRPYVETEENIGRHVSIDIDPGEYEIGDDIVEIATRLLLRRPGAILLGRAIGVRRRRGVSPYGPMISGQVIGSEGRDTILKE